MAKIFDGIEGIPAPKYKEFSDTNAWLKACDRYVKVLQKSICDSFSKRCPEAGVLISFPVGDGKARYIVASLKPVQLVWIEEGSNYRFEYESWLTASDIRREIQKNETIKKLFKRKTSGQRRRQ
jgi:hypothetical protein